MSLVFLILTALAGTVVVAGLTLALYASLPEKFLNHANVGRYAGLTARIVPGTPIKAAPVPLVAREAA